MPEHKEARITPKEQAQSVAYIGGLIAFFIAYLWAEAALALRPQPYHWVTAFGIAALIGVAAYHVVILIGAEVPPASEMSPSQAK